MFPLVIDSLIKDKCRIVAIVDGDPNKQGMQYEGLIPVITPIENSRFNYDYVIISAIFDEEILSSSVKLGVSSHSLIRFWHEELGQYDFIDENPKTIWLLRKKIESLELKLKNYPFEHGMERIPSIVSARDLLNIVINQRKSLARFGDGEFELACMRKRPLFQKPDKQLAKRLIEILQSRSDELCIAIADNFGNLDKYTEEAARAIREYVVENRTEIMSLIDYNRSYFDAYVSRPYLIYRDKRNAETIFNLFKELFYQRKILVVEGEGMRVGVNNDLMMGAERIRRILCPNKNAFIKYDEIFHSILRVADKDELILITLGPTATVLAFDLCIEGFQAIDLGQLDNEYEWFLRGAMSRVNIPGKIVSEVGYSSEMLSIVDTDYMNQIVLNLSK